MNSKKCHEKANIEFIDQYIDTLAIKFYNCLVEKICILNNRGQNMIN